MCKEIIGISEHSNKKIIILIKNGQRTQIGTFPKKIFKWLTGT